jgi:hypothetical protein
MTRIITCATLAALATAFAIPTTASAQTLSKQRAAQAIENWGSHVCDRVESCDYASVDRPLKDCRKVTGQIVLCILNYYGTDGTDDIDCWTVAKARLTSFRIAVSAGHVRCEYTGG